MAYFSEFFGETFARAFSDLRGREKICLLIVRVTMPKGKEREGEGEARRERWGREGEILYAWSRRTSRK